jgi:hypothetical protein
LGGLGALAIRPQQGNICEIYLDERGGCSIGDWQLTIKIAGDRQSACGF